MNEESLFVINSPAICDFLHVILLLGCGVKQLLKRNHPPVQDHLSSGLQQVTSNLDQKQLRLSWWLQGFHLMPLYLP